jgi:hypothetical protein
MKTIKSKINELLLLSAKKIERKDYFKGLKAKMDTQEVIMNELKALAKANKTLLGRIIKFPRADSYAFYVVTKVNKRSVRIDWLDFCDAWIDDRCGKAAMLGIDYARQQIHGEDVLDEMFSKKKVIA